ncbi:MAG: discoidin domain-containing protein, partial [Gemmatimonadota bacterium]|nr:discoidin domain-containing protein [Gemmatimonadota bacterium]
MKVLPLVVGFVLAMLSPAAAAEWQIAQWDQTVHYRLTFNAAEATQAALRLTAVNEYEVFLNGDSVGSDGDWTTVEELAVELQGGANHLAVRVENWGQGNGSGLIVEVVAGEQMWLSTTSGLQEVWRWSGDPQQGTDWLTADVSEIAGWTTVQRGWLERPRLSGWDDSLGAEVIAGYPGGVDVGGDGLSLRTVEGENLALSQSANRPEVFDGQAESVWTIEPDELNSFARVDLGIQRLLGEVRVFTAGENAEDFAANTLQGYAVEVSNDGFQWREVGAIRGIADFAQTAVAFEPIFGRFLRVVATELDPLRRTRVADIQVTGQGVAPSGTFTSAPLDLGLPDQRKIYDRFRWTGQRPAGTALSVQFRTSNDGVSWSDWSPETNASEADLQVPEPRDLLQYRVNFSTDFEDIGPRLDSLIIAFAEQTPTSAARVRVEPNKGVVGRETEFVYYLEVEFDEGDLGVERIRIDMPSLAEVTEIVPPPGMEVARTTIAGDALELVWADLWHQSGQLQLRFRARLLTNQFAFSTRLFSPEAA